MRVEIPCTRPAGRWGGSFAMMSDLEPRMLFASSAAASVSKMINDAVSGMQVQLNTKSSAKVIHIGPGRSIKTLNAVKWPAKGDAPVTFVLDPSSKPYDLGRKTVNGNLTIISASTSKRAVLRLPSSFGKTSKGPDVTSAGAPAITVNGTLTIKNLNTVGGENAILLGSNRSAIIDCENIRMTDGGGIWRGAGAIRAYFKDNEVLGKPRAYVYASFTNPVGKCVIDNRGTSTPVPQGGKMVGGSPQGETAIRVMNVNDLTLINVKTKPWFYKPGKIWKQDIQLRPKSNSIKLINCNFYLADVGDMTWRKPAQRVTKVEFINCTMKNMPHLTTGVGSVKLTNCLVNGKRVTVTVN